MSHRTSTFSLDPELKETWLAMLRSGKYNQTQEYLCDTSKKKVAYCCLGLLCKAAGYNDGKLIYAGFPQDVGFGADLDNTPSKTFLNDADAYQWAVIYKGKMTPLSILNDVDKLTFSQIADIIERQVQTH